MPSAIYDCKCHCYCCDTVNATAVVVAVSATVVVVVTISTTAVVVVTECPGERLMGHTANAAAVIREQLLEEFTATRTLIGSLEQQQQLGASGQHAQLRQVTQHEHGTG